MTIGSLVVIAVVGSILARIESNAAKNNLPRYRKSTPFGLVGGSCFVYGWLFAGSTESWLNLPAVASLMIGVYLLGRWLATMLENEKKRMEPKKRHQLDGQWNLK